MPTQVRPTQVRHDRRVHHVLLIGSGSSVPGEMTDHERLVADVFGVTGDCTPLPGEIDENGKVTAPDGRCYRLRISPPETESALTFRRSVLEAAAGALSLIHISEPTRRH